MTDMMAESGSCSYTVAVQLRVLLCTGFQLIQIDRDNLLLGQRLTQLAVKLSAYTRRPCNQNIANPGASIMETVLIEIQHPGYFGSDLDHLLR
ncbi:hypothetical protein D3C86_2008510 [compost metagenome]